ncbi:TetR/AcrR family transcriptional regulator [Nocardia sp. NPDC050710]|uniref:TetR/AcrR family transcriptional regulator n=1 Tax=Nocardia sp. NPDC050710 TaxID=3157220 RepID=UPI0033D5ABAA
MTATERSAEVLTAAVAAFAESGYAATKTDDIARSAGVSQPYVIRLFGTKQQLFLSAVHRVCDRIEAIFREAAHDIPPDTPPDEAFRILGGGYRVFLSERELLLVLMHGFAASADPVIGDEVRDRFGRIYALIRELTGVSTTDARRFLSTGMLLTVMTAMQVAGPNAVPTAWATEILDDLRAVGD